MVNYNLVKNELISGQQKQSSVSYFLIYGNVNLKSFQYSTENILFSVFCLILFCIGSLIPRQTDEMDCSKGGRIVVGCQV